MNRADLKTCRTAKSDTFITNERKFLVFELADQAYGIEVESIVEILPLPRLAVSPNLPAAIAGFLNLGGTAIPVVRLSRLLHVADRSANRYTPVILLRGASLHIALLVDAVAGVEALGSDAIVCLRENLCFNDCAEGLAVLGNRNVILLSSQRLLSAEEKSRLHDLAMIEQTRLKNLDEAHA